MSAPVWGNPLGCHYHWTEPGKVDAYGDSVRALGNRVDAAVDAFGRMARIEETEFAGEAADSLRERAGLRETETTELRKNLRGLGRAINAYADSLRRHRGALSDLRDFALHAGLEVREGKVWPPVETLPATSSQKEIDAWQDAWEAYQRAFELKVEMRRLRLEAARDLLKALEDHADVHRDEGDKKVATKHQDVRFGELRRDAAEEAKEAVEARTSMEAARETWRAAKQAEADAYAEMQRLLRAGASNDELLAHAELIRTLQGETDAARSTFDDAKDDLAREQREANAAARRLDQAESGRGEPGRGEPSRGEPGRGEGRPAGPPTPAMPDAHGGPADGRPDTTSDRVRSRLG